ncbi:hypothetical protein SESBI_21982 [Sesbania bispinosa]|nr:hypothetical protein SESBI_21982 [Sesbania bispinosa]
MAIPNGTRGLASSVVIIALILPEITAVHIRQQDSTIRVDPLDNLKKYRGGFSITNKHYWSSVIFSAVYGCAIGVFWLSCGMVYGVFLVTIIFCCKSDGGRRTKKILHCNCKGCYLSPIPLAIVLMILAMAASGLVLAGSAKFHSQARTSVNIIIKTANEASEIIHNATRVFKGTLVELESNVGVEASGNLDSTADKFDTAADDILKKATENRRIINKAFKVVFVITIVIISLNLIGVTTLSGITSLVNEVNSQLSKLPGTLFPNIVYLCNPFSAPPGYSYQPEKCPSNTVQIGDIPKVTSLKVLKPYTCFHDNVKKCDNREIISNSEYKAVESYTTSIQSLLNVYPGVDHLLGCHLVKDAFSQVLLKHCKPLKKSARMTWLGMVFLAAIMVFLVVLWIIKAHHEHSYHPSDDLV